MDRPEILGIKFNNIMMHEALDSIQQAIAKGDKKSFSFINADCINLSVDDSHYTEVLRRNDGVFPDGSGIKLACKILDIDLKDNVNGTDMLPLLCQKAVVHTFSIFLLGGKPGVAEQMKANLESCYPGLNICGTKDGFFDHSKENDQVIKEINKSNPDLLLVAFGAPLQEKWIDTHQEKLEAKVLIGVGGLFDFFSGDKGRAPLFIRRLGLEWCYRLYLEPKRLSKRYIIGNPLFFSRIVRSKFKKKTVKGSP
ncbi:MAG: WecB/TagA/CpsF family glycosyltransferase [Lentisphaeraceae bacterium]|nr:WecB/TagA/CpsF family glycosyltransferase [Lentisphaeraceae bacterium]